MSIYRKVLGATAISIVPFDASASLYFPDAAIAPAGFAAMGALGVAALGGYALSSTMRRLIAPPVQYSRLKDIVPFVRINPTDSTLLEFQKGYAAVFRVKGINYQSQSDDEIVDLIADRISWLEEMVDNGSGVNATVISRRQLLPLQLRTMTQDKYLKAVSERWAESFSRSYYNTHYVVIHGKDSKSVYDGVKATKEQLLRYGLEQMVHERNTRSDLWRFMDWLINGDAPHTPHCDDEATLDAICRSPIHFDRDPKHGLIEQIHANGESQFSSPVAINKFKSDTSDRQMMVNMFRADAELTAFQYIKPMSKSRSTTTLEAKKTQQFLFVENPFENAAFKDASDLIQGDQSLICQYDAVFFAQGRSRDEMEHSRDTIMRTLTASRVTPVADTHLAEEQWKARFPTSKGYVRDWYPMTQNVADWVPFEAVPTGATRCQWGNGPFRVFKTAAGSPYSLVPFRHDGPEALGHTAFIAPSESGKTTLVDFLITGALAQYPDLRVFSFDNLHGMAVATQAFGGKYVSPEADLQLAPLTLEDTADNRQFLLDWLGKLAKLQDGEHQEVEQLRSALDMLMPLPKAKRTLARLVGECIETGSPLARRLGDWLPGGKYGDYFTSDRDNLDLDAARWITFDMTNILNHPALASAFLAYVSFRITSAMTSTEENRPHLLFFDECGSLDRDPQFAPWIAKLHEQQRKLDGVVFTAWQSPGQIKALGNALQTNLAGVIFFKNPSAMPETYTSVFEHLRPSDIHFIQNKDNSLRKFKHVVLYIRLSEEGSYERHIINVDLKPLGSMIDLVRGGMDGLKRMHQAKQEVGSSWQERLIGNL